MSRNKKKAAEKAAEIPVEAPEETPVAENDEELTRVREELKTAQEDLTKKQKELDETIRLLQRNQADFENYRRRNNSVRAESYENGKRDAVSELLPSLDDFDRIILNADKADEAWVVGVSTTRSSPRRRTAWRARPSWRSCKRATRWATRSCGTAWSRFPNKGKNSRAFRAKLKQHTIYLLSGGKENYG